MRALCECGNKAMFVIGTPSSGKTTAQKWLKSNIKRQLIEFGAAGISSFKVYNERMQAEPTAILIEDLSVAKNRDIMIKTAFFLTHLVYEKRLVREVQPYPIAIYHFSGSCQIDFQPAILSEMTQEIEFETDIRDKCIRWYHLRMPIHGHEQPRDNFPKVELALEYVDRMKCELPDGLKRLTEYKTMINNFQHQFSEARSIEHSTDLLRALALLNKRKEVNKVDIEILEHLSRNFRVELEIFQKDHLEGVRRVNPDILPILSILATYKTYGVHDLQLAFQLKKTQVYSILNGVSDYVQTTGKNSTIVPTEATKTLLKELGEW